MELGDLQPFVADLAWFEPSHDFFAPQLSLRPLSLATWHLMQITGITLLNEEITLDEIEETRQVAVYIWLHHAPIDRITEALWSGAWRAIYAEQAEPLPEMLAHWRHYRARTLAALSASKFEVQSRKSAEKDDTPKNLIGPRPLPFTLALIARETGWAKEQILWQTWLPQIRQIELAALRWHGSWTVPVKPATTTPVTDFAPDWAKPPSSSEA
jgi:hypothetical protein